MNQDTERPKMICPLCETSAEKVVLRWNGVIFYECAQCTHIFTSKLYELADSNRAQEVQTLYGEHYLDGSVRHRVHYLGAFDRYYDHPRQRLRKLRKFISPPGSLLEIGCNIGYFVKAAQEEGWTPVGLDISPSAIAIAREKAKGIQYKVGKLEDLDFLPNSFDVVCSFHTLEHVATPMETLSAIHRILVPGGFFYAEVPYTRRIIGKKGITDYSVLMEEEHLSHFSPQSLRYALVKSGFCVRRMCLVGEGYGLGILQPRAELVHGTGALSDLLDQCRRAAFAARRIFKWNPVFYDAVRHFYWHTLRQGGGIEVFAQKN
jgi:SAM-dependent methyltransferase